MEYIIQVKEEGDQNESYYLKNYDFEDGFYEIINSKDLALIFNYKEAVKICHWLNKNKKAIDFAVMVEVA